MQHVVSMIQSSLKFHIKYFHYLISVHFIWQGCYFFYVENFFVVWKMNSFLVVSFVFVVTVSPVY